MFCQLHFIVSKFSSPYSIASCLRGEPLCLHCCISLPLSVLRKQVSLPPGKPLHHSAKMWLAILSASGLSWVLQVIALFEPILWVQCVSIIVNGTSGFYIFLAFLCTKKTMLLYYNLFKKMISACHTTSTVITAQSNKLHPLHSSKVQ